MIYKEWPILEAKAKTGKSKYWQIRVLEKENHSMCWVETEWWQENGAHQTAQRGIIGKNEGRSNETSNLEQAVKEAEVEFKKQKDTGYREKGEIIESLRLPMLAHDFKKQGHRIQFPCDGQPKLDGIRALSQSGRGFWSRQGKVFTTQCVEHLRLPFYTDIIFDGELILPKPYTFQQTCSAVKKYDPELSPKLEYHIFDIATSNMVWFARRDLLKTLHLQDNIKLVPVFNIQNKSDAEEKMAELTEQGHEGLMLRNYNGKYIFNQRSQDLQKFKEFIDGEYEVVDILDGVGRESGAAIYTCISQGKTFNVRPKGTYEERQYIFRNKQAYISKWLTVRYQNLTDEGVPRFPVGISIRDYE